MVTITTSLPIISVLKTAINHRKQNPPKPSSYVISQLHFFLDRHTRKKAVPFRYSLDYWCEWRDLNPYVVKHTPLKRACLPVPAHSHILLISNNSIDYIASLSICQGVFETFLINFQILHFQSKCSLLRFVWICCVHFEKRSNSR